VPFPEPGEDTELVALIKESLRDWLDIAAPDAAFKVLTGRIHAYMTQENKRRNLVGEGFEDVIAQIITRVPRAQPVSVRKRSLLHELPGFHAPPPNEKPKRVDLAVVCGLRRVLVSVKWSIRADREEQFLDGRLSSLADWLSSLDY
jgi:hypothetical protein